MDKQQPEHELHKQTIGVNLGLLSTALSTKDLLHEMASNMPKKGPL